MQELEYRLVSQMKNVMITLLANFQVLLTSVPPLTMTTSSAGLPHSSSLILSQIQRQRPAGIDPLIPHDAHQRLTILEQPSLCKSQHVESPNHFSGEKGAQLTFKLITTNCIPGLACLATYSANLLVFATSSAASTSSKTKNGLGLNV